MNITQGTKTPNTHRALKNVYYIACGLMRVQLRQKQR